jgi:signal transduction histidine kinase
MLATSLNRGTYFTTLSNTIHFVSIVLLVFYSKSLKGKITGKDVKIFTLLIIFYAVGFEIIRSNGTFISRQIFTACLALTVYFALLIQIKQQRLFRDSYYLKIFAITTFIEFLLLIIRIIILLSNDYGLIDSLKDVPMFPAAMLWLLLIVNVWSYISINGYWTEKIAIWNTKNLIENTKIKKLLDEKYKLINSLMTVNKTAVSGALTASIAHELNQPLGAIKINSQHLDLLLKSKIEKKLTKNIIQDSDRATKIIATLKGIFTNNKVAYQTIKFDTFVESLKPFFIQATSEKNISIKFLLHSSSASTTISPNQIRQALTNLLQNSIEALSKTKKTNKSIQIKTSINNNKLVFSISDNGPGVDTRFKNKIFELYESSNEENIGLGLWLTKYIISMHKGTISLNTNYPKGAEFLIELPVS